MQHLVLLVLISTTLAFTYLPKVEIDFSVPPKDRWRGALRTILDLYGYDNSFGPVFKFHNKYTFNVLEKSDYTIIAQSIRKFYPEYALELEGLVEEFKRSDVTFEYLAAWAYFHEIGHITTNVQECTGVLVSIGDQIFHGRNMDQAPGYARNIVLHLILKNNGVLLGESVDWYWFKVGFVTLLKYDVASLEENWRIGDGLSKAQLLTFIQNGVPSFPWAYREILLDNTITTYDQVVTYLEQSQVACPLFNIIGGVSANQGAIISRDPFQELPTLTLEDTGQGSGDYTYLVETNYDHWLPDPEEDLRRTVAENLLNKMPEDMMNEFGVFAVMDTYPIHNEGTFYTVIMNAKQNLLIAFGQDSITLSDDE